jgi:hypothetical protein
MELTPRAAADALAAASRYESPLRQRTEGIVLMVWGLATSGLFVTYAFADVLGAGGPGFATLWIPWVGAGTLASFTIWRAAALTRPEPALPAPSRPLLRVLLVSAAMGAAFAVLKPDGPLVPLAITGAAWVLLGGLNVFRCSGRGRLLWASAGLALLAASAALAAFDAPIAVAGTVAIALPGFAAGGLGAWQSLSS